MTKSTILIKTDTSENWAKCEDKYIPAEHIVIAYENEGQPTRYKISDGHTLLRNLPFIDIKSQEASVDDEILLL